MKKFSVVLELQSVSTGGCGINRSTSRCEIGVVAASEEEAKRIILDYYENRLPNRQLPPLKYDGEASAEISAGMTILPIH